MKRAARYFAWALILAGLTLAAYPVWSPLLYRVAQDRLASAEAALLAAAVPPSVTQPSSPGPPPEPGAPVAHIRIPSIGVDATVVEGVERAQLALGPGHVPGTALPGVPGNLSIAGHRTTFGAPFRPLDRLKPGDAVEIRVGERTWNYRVERVFTVNPDEVWVLEQGSESMLTLITCHPPYSAAERLIVRARLVQAEGVGEQR